MKKIIVLALLSVLLLSGCTEDLLKERLDDSLATDADVLETVSGNNQFALDAYAKFRDNSGNVFFSPWSISSALAMTYEGAREETAAEMKNVFYFSGQDVMRPSFAKLYNLINFNNEDYQLSTANALWAQEDYPFLPEYFETVASYYDAGLTNMDFIGATEASRQTINKWVEDQTNDKIKDLIPAGLITPATKLVLTNAVYFKGDWLTQFKEEDTQETDFHVSETETVIVDMMSLFDEEFRYTENTGIQVLELPYKGEDLSMLVLLPDDISSFEESLNTTILDELKSTLVKQEVEVYLPKFKFETKYFMAETLSEMGMPTAFSAAADFSGMTGSKDLMIDQVIHQAFVEVNEEGTEAAAATAVIMKETAAEPQNIFRADKPFIFIIQEDSTGSILFMGRVSNPNQE